MIKNKRKKKTKKEKEGLYLHKHYLRSDEGMVCSYYVALTPVEIHKDVQQCVERQDVGQ